MFYLTFQIFLLNVVLAIIVDIFGGLRDQKDEAKAALANSCFICSIERDTFKRKGVEYLNHIENDHNIWHYVYFFAYLKDKLVNGQELTRREDWISTEIDKRDILKFFPLERAISLEHESQEQLETKVMTKVKLLEDSIKSCTEQQEKLLKENKELKGLVSHLAEELKQAEQGTPGLSGSGKVRKSIYLTTELQVPKPPL